jgi:protein-L-isoaspartate(D-aspartate) O-methyltransferase
MRSKRDKESFETLRHRMVSEQLRGRGIKDERVLAVVGEVPRHLFVADKEKPFAYSDSPIRIDCGQTVSQPYMVALMTQQLEVSPGDRVLEIGTGSGYQTALLAALGARVYTIERHAVLTDQVRQRLSDLGYENVSYRIGDGSLGWPDEMPFDGILVTAGAPVVPDSLRDQLADGGRLVIPVGSRSMQTLVVVQRSGDSFIEKEHTGCIFVPLVGEQGWQD